VTQRARDVLVFFFLLFCIVLLCFWLGFSVRVPHARVVVAMAMESKREQDDVVGDKYAASLASVRAAAERIESYVHKTPVMTSTRINALAGASVFFKYAWLPAHGWCSCLNPTASVCVCGVATNRCECFQKTGSFKVWRGAVARTARGSVAHPGLLLLPQVRGATNAVLTLSDDAASRGITAYSSGNHAQGVAYAASTRKIKAHVVMVRHAERVDC